MDLRESLGITGHDLNSFNYIVEGKHNAGKIILNTEMVAKVFAYAQAAHAKLAEIDAALEEASSLVDETTEKLERSAQAMQMTLPYIYMHLGTDQDIYMHPGEPKEIPSIVYTVVWTALVQMGYDPATFDPTVDPDLETQ